MKKLFLVLVATFVFANDEERCLNGDNAVCKDVLNRYYYNKNYKNVLDLGEKMCNNLNGFGCLYIGHAYKFGNGTRVNLETAKEYYKLACDLEEGFGCYCLGNIYHDEKKNFKLAHDFYKKGYDLNIANSCGDLGGLYYFGEGVRQDYKKALEFYIKGCSLDGTSMSCAKLGVMYEFGIAIRQNNFLAKEYYAKGCDGGNQLACDSYKRLNQQ